MKLSHTVGYALRAVLQLADAPPNTPVPCSKLAADGQMPERFLLQILRSLVTRGILRSTRGVDGGYTLNVPLSDISLLDLIEAVDGPLEASHPLNGGLPDESVRRLSDALHGVNTRSRELLAAIKLTTIRTTKSCAESN